MIGTFPKMDLKKLAVLIAVLAVLALAGCKPVPINNIQDMPAPQATSLAGMEKCIMEAGQMNGWQMTKVKSGVIEGVNRIAGGKHVAVVKIPYSQTHYSILYKSSVNLKESDGKIHRNYNKLVQRLENSIRHNLTLEASQGGE